MADQPADQSADQPVERPRLHQRVWGRITHLWSKTGINSTTAKLMVKGALPPTIAMSCYHSNAWARTYGTLGYVVCIMSILSMPIQPRAKFLQQITFSTLFTCCAAAVACVQLRCVVSARQGTTPSANQSPDHIGDSGSLESHQYNAAGSTVAGVFFFCAIYCGTLVRAYRPALMIPSAQFCVYMVVATVNVVSFNNMSAGLSFIKRLLYVFLTGFACATGVSLFVFPMTSRKIATAQMSGMLGLMKATLKTHRSYIEAVIARGEDGLIDREKTAAEAMKLKSLGDSIAGLFGKARLEISFARKEVAIGKLRPEDFTHLAELLRTVLLPLGGISTFLNIVQNAGQKHDESSTVRDSDDLVTAMRRLEARDWHEVFEMSSEAYFHLQKVLIDAIDHIAQTLEWVPKPKKKQTDLEDDASAARGPCHPLFAQYMKSEIDKYHNHRQTIIQRWSEQKGVNLPATFWDNDSAAMQELRRMATAQIKSKGNQQQLYLQLFAEFIIFSLANAILRMVQFADSKVEDGTMKRMRFIHPGWYRLMRLFSSSWRANDADQMLQDDGPNATPVYMGDSLKHQRDPEHLAPVTTYQRATDLIRKIPKLLASSQSSFAFRAAIAAISLAILCFMRQTQHFFLRQRGLWSLIMVSISTCAHTGQGIVGFLCRILATLIAMVAAIAVYYIGDSKPAAILPLCFCLFLCGWLFILKHPHFALVGLIGMLTLVLLLGYELQANKIGVKVAESNGQEYYRIYLFAPMRLLAVTIGLSTAFFWTYIPYPVTTHATLRREIGNGLYLLANYYSCIHSTIDLRMNHGVGQTDDELHPLSKLDKARVKVLSKCILMLGRVREHSAMTKYEPHFGGRFPKERYDELIDSMGNIFRYLSLISYAANAFASAHDSDETKWVRDFRRFTSEINVTSNDFTSTLCLVSASVTDAQPLPPFLKIPKPYALGEKLADLDPEILSTRHVNEPSYAAFAVLAVTSTLLSDEMGNVIRLVQELVGEVNFTYQILSPPREESDSETDLIQSTWFNADDDDDELTEVASEFDSGSDSSSFTLSGRDSSRSVIYKEQ